MEPNSQLSWSAAGEEGITSTKKSEALPISILHNTHIQFTSVPPPPPHTHTLFENIEAEC